MSSHSICLKQIFQNNRYRLFKLDSQYYLLDCDSVILFIILPFLVYLVKHRCYTISQLEFNTLIISREVQENRLKAITRSSSLAIVISIILPILMNIIKSYIQIPNATFKFVLLISCCIGILFFRFLYSKKHRLNFELNNRESIEIRLFPYYRKMLFQKIYAYLFSLLFFILLTWGLLTVPAANYLVLFSVVVFMFILLFLNIVFLGIGNYVCKIAK